MLTEQQQAEVKKEVELSAYRESLMPLKRLSVRLWEVANSAVVLWFLSAVVVASLSAWIAERERNAQLEHDSRVRFERLRYEVAARWRKLSTIVKAPGPRFAYASYEADFIEFLSGYPSRTAFGGFYPEFKEYPLSALLIELELHPRTEDKAEAGIRRLRHALTFLTRSLNYKIPGRPETENHLDDIEKFVLTWRDDALETLGYRGDREFLENDDLAHYPDFPATE